ncbi:hypothetical protein [Streptomyces sp. NPDC086787]|uniref:hypothetical protein n=1 Tax=Streptomyces sp. NPDC086787 TaxID=3365759 RepID=UPI0038102E7D
MPSSPPPAPPDGLRAAAVALLNLSGLGLGYVLVRRWILAAVCWAATAALLLVALPADVDGVPGAAITAYVGFLVLAAVHGAAAGLRTRLVWPGRAPLALLLGVLLLAVPAGGALLYDDAHDEAVEQQLLDRLERADQLVASAGRAPFETAKSDYRTALDTYRDLAVDHPGSRAARNVHDSLTSYYSTVGAAYGHKDYCDAVAPLTYLRTVPRTMPKEELGTLTRWPDDRLATSLYECGSSVLSVGRDGWATNFGALLDTFPQAPQTTKVAPAVEAAVTGAEKNVSGSDPCTAVERLRGLKTQISTLAGSTGGSGDTAGRLTRSADRAGRSAGSGEYSCGVDQYKDGDFAAAQKTMDEFVAANAHDSNRERAKKISIAAVVAQTVPAAGKRLPGTDSGGSISVTVKNDSPDPITVYYTGTVTGSFTLKACGGCKAYPFASSALRGFKPCSDSGRDYPERTISLPTGTVYFVHKPQGRSGATPASDTVKLRSGYIYTECAYSTQTLGSGSLGSGI